MLELVLNINWHCCKTTYMYLLCPYAALFTYVSGLGREVLYCTYLS